MKMICKSTTYQVGEKKTKVLPRLARTPSPTLTLSLLKGQLHCFLRTRRQHSSGTLQYPSRKLFPLPSFGSTAIPPRREPLCRGGGEQNLLGHSHERSAGRYRKYSTMHSGGSVALQTSPSRASAANSARATPRRIPMCACARSSFGTCSPPALRALPEPLLSAVITA